MFSSQSAGTLRSVWRSTKRSTSSTSSRRPGGSASGSSTRVCPSATFACGRPCSSPVDAEDILRGAVGPAKYWRTCASIWSCGTAWETDAGSEVYNVKDLDQARQLVKDAGQEGYEVKFIVGEYHPVLAGSSKVVRDIMESIGLKVD